eukprot:m.150924 g.150924  ORF g.150924 m.150924 type:complete len:168 (+) comp17840_c0_seq2:158-661(+)
MADNSQNRSEIFSIYGVAACSLVAIILVCSALRKQHRIRLLGSRFGKNIDVEMKHANIPKEMHDIIHNGIEESRRIGVRLQKLHAEHYFKQRQLKRRALAEGQRTSEQDVPGNQRTSSNAQGSKETAPLDGSVSGQSETPVDDIVAFGTESTWDTSGNPPRMTESSI